MSSSIPLDPNARMPTRAVLLRLGFTQKSGELADRGLSYSYDFKVLHLRASESVSRFLKPVFLFSGVLADGRSIGEVSFEMPLFVESFEQGVAWIAYYLRQRLKPRYQPEWLSQGAAWKHHLPWVQHAARYALRPQCQVEREWLKLAMKKLRSATWTEDKSPSVILEFDGIRMRIHSVDVDLMLPGKGNAWPTAFAVQLDALCRATRRLMQPLIDVGVWEEQLQIANRRIALIRPTQVARKIDGRS